MKKIIFLLAFFSLALAQKSFAQPSYCFTPQQVEAEEGDTVCIDLKVRNFTDIIGVQFTLKFDQTALQLISNPNGITNLNPSVTGLDITDFGTGLANTDGIITFIWNDGQPCQNAIAGVNLPDGSVLFSVCFKAIGDYGTHSAIEFATSPVDRITQRATAACFDIGEEEVCNGYISIGTSPLTINIGSGDGFTNDVVCVDFKVEDFNDLISAQYFVSWDTSVLEYFSAMKMNLGSSGDQYNINYAQTAQGMLASVWYSNDLTIGHSLPDGTAILQMCFKIKGVCGESSPIWISNNPNSSPPEPIEVIDVITVGSASNGQNIGLLQTQGQVTVNCNNPNGLTLKMDDKNVCPGESFTVDVRVEDFSQIAKLMFDLKWNNQVIKLDSVSYPVQTGSANCLPFSNGVDISDAITLGLLHMDWQTFGQGCNKPDNYILFRLHFKAIGASGSNSTIAIVDPIFVDKFGGQSTDIGINNNNSLVTLCALSNPTIVAGSENGNPGSNLCIDFTVQDFDAITSMGYTIGWEPTILQFTGVQGFGLTGLTAANFNTSQAVTFGVIGLDWSNAAGVTLPDGVSIYSVCFNVIGDPDSCTAVLFDDLPWPINIETSASNATNVGLNGQAGEVCVTNPFIFTPSFPDLFAGQYSSICVDLTVDNFNQLTNTEYSINWDPTVLEFTGLTPSGALPNFGVNNYNASDVDDGNLTIDWAAANQILGFSLADGTSILELCFDVIGSSGECSPLSITGFPQSTLITSATTGSANLSLGNDDGSVCVSGTIFMDSYVVTDVSCGGNPNGAIDVTIAGGSGRYGYNWTGPGVNETAEDQVNIGVGYYTLTVFDSLNPALEVIQPFNVVYLPNATFANAGQDTTFSCGNFFMTLNGTGSTAGPNTTYFWSAIGLGQIITGQGTLTPNVVGGSLYKLTVTAPGCVDTDTVKIFSATIPVPFINDSIPLSISCKVDTVILDGTLSSAGYDIQWTGPAIVPGTGNFLTPQVTAPGEYILTLTSAVTGCTRKDTIMVLDDLTPPISDAGPDQVLGCSQPSAPLGGPNTSTGADFIYDWVPVGIGQICGNPQAPTIFACSAGTFQLTVTDTTNGCSAMSEVIVTGNNQSPMSVIEGLGTMSINCTVDSVTLDASVGSSAGTAFTYTWTLLPNTIVAQGVTTITVGQPGTYRFEVLDTTNDCSAIDEVIVTNDINTPLAMALASNAITCLVDTSMLSSTGSDTGPNITYEWVNSMGTTIGNTPQLEVNAPGNYQLIVTNTTTTCQGFAAVTVVGQTAPPFAEAGDAKQINCFGDPVLDGETDPNTANLLIQWTGPGVGCLTNASTLNPTAHCEGEYKIQVYNSITGCVGVDSVMVTEDLQPPVVDAGTTISLPCAGSNVELQGTTNITDFEANWVAIPSSLPISDPTILNPTISQPGTYNLTITSNVNGCSAIDFVVADAGSPNLQANAGNDDAFNCQETSVTLDASGSTPANTIVSYEWRLVGGSVISNNTTVDVTQAGTYELLIVSNEGCQDRDSVVVDDTAIDVVAVANVNGVYSCANQTVTLNGTGSNTGTSFSYIWTDATGTIAGNGITTTVSAPGVYELTVFDSQSLCSDSVEVNVIADNSGLEQANAQVDFAGCEAEATLVGNLPANATGAWTSLSEAVVTTPDAATTTATNLTAGNNTFVWTLSLGDCANYSADTIEVSVDMAIPQAVNDNTILQPGTGGEATINVLENDEFSAENSVFSLLPYTGFGEVVANDSGDVVFTKEKCQVGNIEIGYKICSESCPDLCDEATLTINILADETEGCDEIPNGITPNEDGINDALVFDLLLDETQEYPDNEILIFNRWGDVVYSAKPYNNDWKGTNQSGDELPQATYYYILQLNIGDGVIIRGDVTILK